MAAYIIQKSVKVNYERLERVIQRRSKEIMFVQWLSQEKGDLYPCPNIFVGDFIGLNSNRDLAVVNGVGAIHHFFLGTNYFPIEKRIIAKTDDYLGLARITDSRRNLVFEDSDCIRTWDKYYAEMIKQLHNRKPSDEIKDWLGTCKVGCLQYHILMDVYLKK